MFLPLNWTQQVGNYPVTLLLADEHFDTPGAIDLLIGADLFYDILLSDQRTRKGYPVLQKTVLGWIISGKTPAVNSPSSTQRSFFLRETTPLEANLNRFWEVQPEPCSTFTPEQQACEQHFVNHVHQQEDGRFIVRLPLKEDSIQLGKSRRQAAQPAPYSSTACTPLHPRRDLISHLATRANSTQSCRPHLARSRPHNSLHSYTVVERSRMDHQGNVRVA